MPDDVPWRDYLDMRLLERDRLMAVRFSQIDEFRAHEQQTRSIEIEALEVRLAKAENTISGIQARIISFTALGALFGATIAEALSRIVGGGQ